MASMSRLVSQIATYGVSSVLVRLLNFLLVPLYTEALMPGVYGVISYIYAVAAFLNVLCTFGLETSYFRFANDAEITEPKAFSSALQSQWLMALPILLLILVFSDSLSPDLWTDSRYLYLLIAVVATDAWLALPFAKLRQEAKSVRFAALKTVQVGVTLVLNLILIYLPYKGWISPVWQEDPVIMILAANLIANLLLAFVFYSFPKFLFQRADISLIQRMLTYSFPLMVMGMAGMVNEVLDRILLEKWLPTGFYEHIDTAAAIGVYSACYKISILITLGIQAFRYAAEPYFFHRAKSDGAKQEYAKIMHVYISAASIAMLAIVIHLDIIKHLLRNPAYHIGLSIVPVLLLGNVFLGIFYNLSVWYKLSDRTYMGTILTVSGALVTVVGNYFLIPVLGFLGAAWATLLCYACMTLASFLIGQRYFYVPYHWIKGVFILGICTAVSFLFFHFQVGSSLLKYALGWAALAGIGLLIYRMSASFIRLDAK